MTETTRLYYDDAYCADFTARVIAHGTVAGHPTLALDRSAFSPPPYPCKGKGARIRHCGAPAPLAHRNANNIT